MVRGKHLVSIGYNGSAPGESHCISLQWCAKSESLPCRAEGLHAESNALAFAAKLGISVEGATLYTVYSPCRACCNILKVAGIAEIIYKEVYSGFTDGPEYMKELRILCRKI